MGMGYKCGSSGGELAFRVVSYTTEQALAASAPAEGTLGIVTDDLPITGWSIQDTQPETAQVGHLWIRTGTSSLGSVNALLRNALVIRPIGARQLTAAGWGDRLGMTYLEGSWRSWEPETACLYKAWDQNPTLTGGWVGTDGSLDCSGGTMAITARKDGGSLTYGAAYTQNAVELTPWNRASITVTAVDGGADSERYFALFRETPTGQPGEAIEGKLLTFVKISESGTVTLDLSGITGAYRVGFYLRGYGYNQASLTAGEIRLEKAQEVTS